MSKIKINLGFSADTSQARREMQSLSQAINQITEHSATLIDDSNLREGVQAAKELATHLQRAYDTDTGKLNLAQFSKSLSTAGQDLKYFQNNLSKLGVEGEQAFLRLAKSIVTADTPTIKLNSHVKNLLDDLIKVGRWQFSSGVMHEFVGLMQTAYGYAQDLNESLTNIGIVTGQNTNQLGEFAAKANAAAKELSATTLDYTDAALIYFQQGLDDDAVKERTDITIKMANAVNQSAETVSEQLTAIWNNYYDGSKSLEYYADVLMKLGAVTASSSDEISEGLGKFSAVADSVGLSYEYASTALATVTATTRESANTVGTAFKTLFARIQGLQLGETLDDGTDLNKYSEALNTVGINIKDVNGQIRNMDDILDDLGSRWGSLAKDQQLAVAQTVAGVRQYNQLVALMDNWGYFQELLGEANSSAGELAKQADIFGQGWEASLNRVRTSAEEVYMTLLNDDFFIALNDGFATALEGVNGFVKGLGGMKGMLSSAAAIFLSVYAKEMPSIIDKATSSIQLFFGKTTKEMTKIQQDTQRLLSATQFDSGSASNEMERESLLKIAELKKQLIQQSGKMSAAEQEEAKAKIESITASSEKVIAMRRELEAQERLANVSFDRDITTDMDDITAMAGNYNRLQAEIEATSIQLYKMRQEGRLGTSDYAEMHSYLDQLEDDFNALTTDGPEKNFRKIAVAAELTNKEIEELGKRDPTKLLQADDKKVQASYNKIKKAITDTKNELQKFSKQNVALTEISEFLGQQKKSWEENSISIDKATKEAEEYIQAIQSISDDNGLNLNLDEARKELESIKNAAQNPQANIQGLRQQLLHLTETMGKGLPDACKVSTEGLTNAATKLIALKGNTPKVRQAVQDLILSMDEHNRKIFLNSEAYKYLIKSQDETIQATVKLSTVFTQLASTIMQTTATMNAVSNAYKTLNDEDSSGLEKATAILGTIIQIGQMAVGTYKTLTTASEYFAAAKIKEGVAIDLTSGAVSKNTIAVKLNALAFKVHPIFIIVGIITAVITALGALSAKWEEDTARIKENAEAITEQTKATREALNTNSDLISSMSQLLESYQKTGEGKEELDEVTNSLAEAYNLEGAALATLTGKYSDYSQVLENAKRIQEQEVKKQQEEEKKAISNQKVNILRQARDGNGRVNAKEDKYSLNFEDVFASKTDYEVVDKLAQFAGGVINNAPLETNWGITINNDVGSIIELYDNLVKAKNSLLEEFKDDPEILASSDVFRELEEYIERMSSSIEAYREHQDTITSLDLLGGTNQVSDLQSYYNWINKTEAELAKAGKTEEEIAKIIQATSEYSVNPAIEKYEKMAQTLQAIISTGTKVSEGTLEKLWDSLDKGNSKWDEATLLALNWSSLTEESWEAAANAAQKYTDAVNYATNVEILKENAKEAQKIIKDGIDIEALRELQDAFDWGNAEQGVMEYVDFLRLTEQEQIKYINNLAETSIVDSIDKTISAAQGKIAGYQIQLAELIKLTNDVDLEEAQKVINLIEEAQSMTYSEINLDENFSGINWKALGMEKAPSNIGNWFKSNSVDDFKKQIGYDNLLELNFDIKATEDSIKETEKQIEELQEQRKIEMMLNPDPALIEEYIDNLEILATFKPDTEEYQKALDAILNADNSIKIAVESQIDESLEKTLEDIEKLKTSGSLIGDSFRVAAEDVRALSEAYPGILEGYTQVSHGVIQLNEETVDKVLTGIQKETEANYQSQIDITKGEIEVTKNKIATWKDEIEALKTTLTTENGLYQSSYAQTEVDNEIKNESIGENNDKANLNTTEGNEDVAVSYEALYKSAEQNVKDFTDNATKYLEYYTKYQNAILSGDEDTANFYKEKLGEIDSKVTNTYGKQYSGYTLLSGGGKAFNDPDWYLKAVENATTKYKNQYLEDTVNSLIAAAQAELEKDEKKLAGLEDQQRALEILQQQSNEYFNNLKAGLGADGKLDSSGKSKTQEDATLGEKDTYSTINNLISDKTREYEKQQEITSQMDKDSKEYLESLAEEKRILGELISLYEQKLELSKADIEENRKLLEDTFKNAGYEIKFDEKTGSIINETDLKNAILNNLQPRLDAAIASINSAIDDTSREAAEQEKEKIENLYDFFIDLIDGYKDRLELGNDIEDALLEYGYKQKDIDLKTDEWYADELKRTQDKIKEEYEKNFEKLETELDLTIKIDDTSLKLLDYYVNKLSDDFYTMAEAAEYMLKKQPAIENSLQTYDTFFNNLKSSYEAGQITSEDYAEGLQTSYDGVLDNLQALQELDKEMMHYYEDTLFAAKEELDNYTNSLEHLTKVLDHYKNIVKLVDGEYNFEAMDTILRGQTKTIGNELEVTEATYQMMVREKEAIEASMASVAKGSAAWELFNEELKAATKAVEEAEDEMLSKTEEWAEAMKAVMENTFDQIAYDLERAMTSGMGFDALNSSLDRLSAYQDVYLTTTNEVYELSKLMREASQAADKTDSQLAKQKLNTYIKEIDALKNDGIPLSKTELALAQARYEVLKAELALEDAKNAKSTVRLQRDSEGNFGYVYTADGEAIAQAEQDLMDAQNQLYNIGLDAANEYGSKLLELQQQLQEDWMQLERDYANGRFANEEEYNQARERLIREYSNLFTAYSKEYTLGLTTDVAIQEEAWINAYDSMINQTLNWESYVDESHQRCKEAVDEWQVAVKENNEIVQGILNNTKEKVDTVTTANDDLKKKVKDEVIPTIEEQLRLVRDSTSLYASWRDSIEQLILKYEELAASIRDAIQAQLEMERDNAAKSYDVSGIPDYSQAMADYLSESVNHSTSDPYYQALVKAREEKMKDDKYATERENDAALQTLMTKYELYRMRGEKNALTEYVESLGDKGNVYYDWDKVKKLITQFASGGYTGAWGPEGRMAILHQKELVLNESDTMNFLRAAEILRQVSDLIDLEAMSNKTAFGAYGSSGYLCAEVGSSTLEQSVTIEANFPGVQDRYEIEEAFNNLINTASQYANRK